MLTLTLNLQCDSQHLFEIAEDRVKALVARANGNNVINIPEWMCPEAHTLYRPWR